MLTLIRLYEGVFVNAEHIVCVKPHGDGGAELKVACGPQVEVFHFANVPAERLALDLIGAAENLAAAAKVVP